MCFWVLVVRVGVNVGAFLFEHGKQKFRFYFFANK